MAENWRRPGALRDRLHFQSSPPAGDGWGGPPIPGAGIFTTQFTLSAGMRPRTGSEAVTAARLGGRQPYVVTVRANARLKQVTPAWRLADARAGETNGKPNRVFQIVAPPTDPDGKNQWIELLVVEGPPS